MSLFDIPAQPSAARSTPAPKAAKPPMEPWLKRQLEAAGHMDATTGATRRTRATFCRHCRRGVMRGLTSLPMAWSVDADPVPLSVEGEALALICGVETYELRWVGDHYELERRTPMQIKLSPTGKGRRFDVLAEHKCGTPAAWPRADTRLAQGPAPHHSLPIDPPF